MKKYHLTLCILCSAFSTWAQVMIKDINPGVNNSSLYSFTKFGAFIYFIADDGVHGNELWRTDGTDNGTTMVIDLNPGAADGLKYCTGGRIDVCSHTELCATDNALYFWGVGANGLGLWKTLGTAESTELLIQTALQNFEIGTTYYLSKCGNKAVFTYGNSLWVSDGTDTGTHVLLNAKGDTVIGANNFISYGNKAFFDLDSYSIGLTDGTSSGTFTDTISNYISYTPISLFNGNGYFTAQNDSSQCELYKIDTSSFNITVVKTFPAHNFATCETILDSSLILYVTNADTAQLWKTDGTTVGTVLGTDIPYGLGFIPFRGRLYFCANTNNINKLFSTDCTPNGTIELTTKGFNIIDGKYSGITFNDRLVFNFLGETYDFELWGTDGTPKGTGIIKDICPGICSSDPSNFFTAENFMLFTANDGQHGWEPWRLDSTFSIINSIHEVELPSVTLYPNPASDFINIHAEQSLDISSVSVFDITGKEVIAPTKLVQNTLPVFNLTAGMYFLYMQDKSINKIATAKFIKE